MNKRMLMTAVLLVSLFALNACCTIAPAKVIYSDGLEQKIEEVKAKAAILITDKGEVLVYNEQGNRENVRKCRIPDPVKKIKRGDKYVAQAPDSDSTPSDVCIGLQTGSAITALQTLSILKSNSKDCLIIGIDRQGNPIEVCWVPR